MISVLLSGANGAMGKVITDIAASRNIKIVAGFDKDISQNYDYPVYGSLSEIKEDARLVIDFSHYTAQREVAQYCLDKKIPLVSATTSLSNEDEDFLRFCANRIAVFRSKNYSYGISVLKKLVREASRLLHDGFDVELIEAHHNKKVDAPSGTAELLVQAVIEGAGKDYTVSYGRYGKDARREGNQLTVHSIRGGTIAGTHTIMFAGAGEVVTLTHEAGSKEVFAAGALKAAKFIFDKSAGYYTMDDMINEEL